MEDLKKVLSENEKIVLALIICITFSFSFSYVLDYKIDLNGDNAKYYLLAESISSGKGYVSVYSPGEPPTSVYPPGYPALMSTVMVFTKSVTAQKILNGIFLLLSGLGLFYLVNRIVEDKYFSFFLSIMVVLNFHLLKFSTMMMSEISFVLFSIISLYFFINTEGRPWRDVNFYLFVASLSFAFHIRTQGVGLLGGFLFYYLFRRKWSHLSMTAVGFFLLALPWRIRNQIQGLGSSRYLDQLVQVNPWRPEKGEVSVFGLVERFVDQGIMVITKAIPDSIFNFVGVNYQNEALFQEWVIGLVVISVMIYGFWSIEEYNLFFIGYFISVFVIVSSWSATVDNRYLVTIIPFLQLGFFYGAYVLGRRYIGKIGLNFEESRVLYASLLVVALLMIPGLGDLHAKAERSYPRAYYNYFQSANELGQKVGCRGTVVSCRKPAMFYLFSNCHSTKYKSSKNNSKVIKDMIDKDVDYVVLEQLGFSSTARYLYPAIKNNRELFTPVIHKKKPDTYTFRFESEVAEEKFKYK